jgi:hypothetical protein
MENQVLRLVDDQGRRLDPGQGVGEDRSGERATTLDQGAAS